MPLGLHRRSCHFAGLKATLLSIFCQSALLSGLAFIVGGCVAFAPVKDQVENAPASASTEAPEFSTPRHVSAAQLQRTIMDFSDHYVSALWVALDEYIGTETDAAKRTNAQKWKVMLGATSMTIAGSQDPRAGLLDMAVFISAGKWALDNHWIPGVFGERAAPLRAVYREMDKKIWEEVGNVLTPAQQSDLRSLINAWVASDPPRNQLLDVRLRNLEGVVLSDFAEQRSARGLMASIQRLLGKVDQSLLYGERMIFYMERVPRILTQQSDLTIDRVAERFPIATINPDFSGLADMAANLPQHVSDVLQDQEGLINQSLPEVRKSLESAERITLSLQETFDSVNSLAAKIEALPFESGDYATAWEQTSSTLTKLDSLVQGLNDLLDGAAVSGPQAGQLAQALDAQTDRILDKAFQRGLILIGVFFGGVLICLVAAKLLFRRKISPPPSSSS
ncbi:MAG: hypothetical protein WEB60_09255 [Terrimicrobiaceae bacterium]